MFDILKTKDGSDTVFSKQFNATFHSIHGALHESRHVFIENGLRPALLKFKEIELLEIGLGSALNLMLTLKEIRDKPICYTAIEKFPLPADIYTKLNYAKDSDFLRLHQLPWNEQIEVKKGFILIKNNSDFLDFTPRTKFNLVYYDAFAPNTQDELWNKKIFEKLYDMMQVGGLLVTYCAKGELKRNLKEIGFMVETLAGPPGKREMTRAIKQ